MSAIQAVVLVLLVSLPLRGVSFAQVVQIDSGAVLTEADLVAGVFNGQEFVLGPNTTFEVNDGGTVEQVGDNLNGVRFFDFQGSVVNVNAGGQCASSLSLRTYISNASINIREDGLVGAFGRLHDCQVVISGGTLGSNTNLIGASSIKLCSGELGREFDLLPGVPATIAGGVVGDSFDVGTGCVVDILGGQIGVRFRAPAQSTVNLFARAVQVDGVPIALEPSSSVEITARDASVLTATLADGSFFDYILNVIVVPGQDSISPNTLLTATFATLCPADANGDGELTPGDFNAWVLAFNSTSPFCDQNDDGLCTPADFNAWIVNFNAGCG